MLIKGEKWACDACVRGHRVSNCQHTDRKLQHINKKGRPVSQCVHCRALRKSRSAHVRCDCGEKAHSKGACTHGADTQADDCCCSHGGRCSCALKKEHLDPVPESDSDEPYSTDLHARPRAFTSPSEGALTVFANGHHKPTHKHNNMASKCGLPYVVPKAHSIQAGLANRSVDNLPHTSTIEALHSQSQIKDSMVSAQQEQRLVKSEHGSPFMNATSNLDLLNGSLPPLDLSNMPNELFLHTDYPDPLYSGGLSATSIDWSHYDGLDFNNDTFASSYSQAASFTGFDFSGNEIQPALTTTSTSGEISEVEDFPTFDTSTNQTQNRPSLLNNQFGSDISDFGNEVDYRLSASSSYMGMPQPLITDNMSTMGSNHGLPSIDYNESGKPLPSFDINNFPPMSAEENAMWFGDLSGNSTINTFGNTVSEPVMEEPWIQ